MGLWTDNLETLQDLQNSTTCQIALAAEIRARSFQDVGAGAENSETYILREWMVDLTSSRLHIDTMGRENFVPWFLAGFQAASLTVCLAGTIFSPSRYSEIPFPGLLLPISRNHMEQLWRIVEQQGTFLIFAAFTQFAFCACRAYYFFQHPSSVSVRRSKDMLLEDGATLFSRYLWKGAALPVGTTMRTAASLGEGSVLRWRGSLRADAPK